MDYMTPKYSRQQLNRVKVVGKETKDGTSPLCRTVMTAMVAAHSEQLQPADKH